MDYSWCFTEAFTENANKLYELLSACQFNSSDLITRLNTNTFSIDDINMAAFRFVESCHDADFDALNNQMFDSIPLGTLIPDITSSHMAETIEILLDYGLDPNKVFVFDDGSGEANIMKEMMFVYNGYQSADAVAAMFEHGGNPSLIIEEMSLIRQLNFEMQFFLENESVRYFADSVVHYWMVFIGYGAKLEDGGESIDPVGSFEINNLRNHRQYYYGAINSDRSNDGMEICFFDKDTNWEVARY